MAENLDPASPEWVGFKTFFPGEFPLWTKPINIEKLTAEVNQIIEDTVAGEIREKIYYQAKAKRYRRQRNSFAVILAGIIVNKYLNARERREAERVNPPKEM
jgi:hypothetical protein